MKKIISILLVICMMACLLTGCKEEETVYTVAKKDFYYSEDNGSTYGNRRIKFEVGQEIYMQLQIEVDTNKEDVEELKVNLKIPNIDAVDSYYYSGQKITPVKDEINNVTVYTFTIATNDTSLYFFKFVPTSESTVQMELDFEEPVPDRYDTINTIEFVATVEEDAGGEE